ncbi:MAG: hypothetical protein ACOY3P_00780 [Planctomycetota bacterium]
MHPASRLLIYLLAALVIPGLPLFLLPVLLLLAIISNTGRQPWRLLWRTRWLLLVLFLGYAYSLPGDPFMPWLGELAPTREGVLMGGRQALRLMVLLLWLDVLVLRLPTTALMGGLYVLLQPFARAGLHVEQAAVRLGLTLCAIETLERGRGNLRRLFNGEPGMELPATIQLDIQPLRARDLPLPVCLAGLLIWLNV